MNCWGSDPLRRQGVPSSSYHERGGLTSRYHPERPASPGTAGSRGMLGLFEVVWMLLSRVGGYY
jgi:hypothetical protein